MSKRSKSEKTDRQREHLMRLPLRLVFSLSTLSAALTMLFAIAVGEDQLYRILLRAMLVFVGVAVAGTLVMAVTITVLWRIKQDELAQQLRLAEEEQLAASMTLSGTVPHEPGPLSGSMESTSG
jgi:hypothetical protein